MNRNDFDEWNREAIISRALEYRSDAERYRRMLIDLETAHSRVTSERDRLREAFQEIAALDFSFEVDSILSSRIAEKALQEAEDER